MTDCIRGEDDWHTYSQLHPAETTAWRCDGIADSRFTLSTQLKSLGVDSMPLAVTLQYLGTVTHPGWTLPRHFIAV